MEFFYFFCVFFTGTNVEYEKKRLSTMNIIICTPGRLLQHMDENESFSYNQLQILIIDEADRILDLGFKRQVIQLLITFCIKILDGFNY